MNDLNTKSLTLNLRTSKKNSVGQLLLTILQNKQYRFSTGRVNNGVYKGIKPTFVGVYKQSFIILNELRKRYLANYQ